MTKRLRAKSIKMFLKFKWDDEIAISWCTIKISDTVLHAWINKLLSAIESGKYPRLLRACLMSDEEVCPHAVFSSNILHKGRFYFGSLKQIISKSVKRRTKYKLRSSVETDRHRPLLTWFYRSAALFFKEIRSPSYDVFSVIIQISGWQDTSLSRVSSDDRCSIVTADITKVGWWRGWQNWGLLVFFWFFLKKVLCVFIASCPDQTHLAPRISSDLGPGPCGSADWTGPPQPEEHWD